MRAHSKGSRNPIFQEPSSRELWQSYSSNVFPILVSLLSLFPIFIVYFGDTGESCRVLEPKISMIPWLRANPQANFHSEVVRIRELVWHNFVSMITTQLRYLATRGGVYIQACSNWSTSKVLGFQKFCWTRRVDGPLASPGFDLHTSLWNYNPVTGEWMSAVKIQRASYLCEASGLPLQAIVLVHGQVLCK